MCSGSAEEQVTTGARHRHQDKLPGHRPSALPGPEEESTLQTDEVIWKWQGYLFFTLEEEIEIACCAKGGGFKHFNDVILLHVVFSTCVMFSYCMYTDYLKIRKNNKNAIAPHTIE